MRPLPFSEAPMDLAAIYAPIQRNLDALDGLLRAELATRDPFIGELVEYVLSTRGKLVRPALTCLAAEAIGGGEEERLFIAGTVELIHIASLIHDDIIDEADVRRRNPTVNVQWGNQIAVLLGDLLFARAFDLISRVRHPEVAPAGAFAAVRMSQGEIQQIEYGAEPHSEEAVYLDIIEGKTAALFSAACRSGALVAGATAPQAAALAAFGLAWGVSFQIPRRRPGPAHRAGGSGQADRLGHSGREGDAAGDPRAALGLRQRPHLAGAPPAAALPGRPHGGGPPPAEPLRRHRVRAGWGPPPRRAGRRRAGGAPAVDRAAEPPP